MTGWDLKRSVNEFQSVIVRHMKEYLYERLAEHQVRCKSDGLVFVFSMYISIAQAQQVCLRI